MTVADGTPRLEVRGLTVGYGAAPVVCGIDLEVRQGEVVALLGANGAGKTTTLLALSGQLSQSSGTVALSGALTRAPFHRRAQAGLAFVMEGRAIFKQLSTLDNLRLARCDVEKALAMFPELRTRLKVKAGLLSGGEQQMLDLARSLARRPTLLLADELSLGLAPLVVDRLHAAVREAAVERGVGVLLVEQHVRRALKVADRGYVMKRGEVVLSGSAHDLRARAAEIEALYLDAGTKPAQPDDRRHDG